MEQRTKSDVIYENWLVMREEKLALALNRIGKYHAFELVPDADPARPNLPRDRALEVTVDMAVVRAWLRQQHESVSKELDQRGIVLSDSKQERFLK